MTSFQFQFHRHLNLLRTFVDGNVSNLRQLALQILRNMSFDVRNRSALLTSDDFNYVAYTVLDNGTPYEKLMIVTSIWKLIAQNFKGKNTIKNSKIFNRLQRLENSLEAMSNAAVVSNRGEDNDGGQLIEEIFDELRIAVNHTMGILHAWSWTNEFAMCNDVNHRNQIKSNHFLLSTVIRPSSFELLLFSFHFTHLA